MMPPMTPPTQITYAKIIYQDGAVTIARHGTHVICAVTGKPIALEELRYWSVAHQEAYIDAVAALAALKRHERE